MAACVAHGISHSHFLGGPPVWTPEDRDKAVWYEIHKREACPSCGTRPDEWDPDKGGHDHAYLAQLQQCPGCATKAPADKKASEKPEPGWTARLVRNPGAR